MQHFGEFTICICISNCIIMIHHLYLIFIYNIYTDRKYAYAYFYIILIQILINTKLMINKNHQNKIHKYTPYHTTYNNYNSSDLFINIHSSIHSSLIDFAHEFPSIFVFRSYINNNNNHGLYISNLFVHNQFITILSFYFYIYLFTIITYNLSILRN